MTYTMCWYQRGTCTTFTGMVTIEEVNEVNDKHYGDARFDKIKYQLFDFTQADISGITLDDIKYPAAFDKAATNYKPKFKAAIVVSDEHGKALCQAYIDYSRRFNNDWDMQIFDNYDQAVRWCESTPKL